MNTVEIQVHLKALGFNPGLTDGKPGPKTAAAITEALKRHAPDFASTAHDRREVAVEQLIMREVGKIEVGKIDGLEGPQTLHARTIWRAGSWRDQLEAPLSRDAYLPPVVRTRWPGEADVTRFFGKPGENQVMLTTPFPMRLAWDLSVAITRFQIHERVHASAERVLKRVLDHYGPGEVSRLGLDRFGGCLNVRRKRGGSAWSLHSWGVAIDFDPARNQLSWGADRAQLARPEYEMFWRLWSEEGWLSLGKARNYDWMHVQAARP